MITFRKILAASAGALVRAYFTEGKPEPERDLRCEPGKPTASGSSLTAYYTGREMRAHWRVDMPAAVAEALGIDPLRSPKATELDHLFEAKRGDSGEKWSKYNRVNSAIDLTYAPHKSISLAVQFAETPAEAAMLWTTILRANDKAMRMAAYDLGWARKGHDGEDGAERAAVGWVSFPHEQARPTLKVRDGKDGITYLAELPTPGDPHCHVHNPLFNLAAAPDGRIGSLDTQRLTSTRVLVWGALGQAVQAAELRRLGARVAVDASGRFAVLSAIDPKASDHFSKGDKQAKRIAKAYADKLGLDWTTLSAKAKYGLFQSAAAHERRSKEARSGLKREGGTPRELWQSQAEDIGWSHRTVLEGTTYAQLTDAERYDLAYTHAAKHLADEFKTAAVLDQDVVTMWAIRGLIGAGYRDMRDIKAVTSLLEERGFDLHGERAFLVAGVKEGRLRVTNTEQVRIERRVMELAAAAAQDRSGALDHAAVRQAIDAAGLDFSNAHGRAQVAAIYSLAQAGGMAFLTGIAGAGKSTLLQPLIAAYHADTRFDPRGREVIGTAVAWIQADALKGADALKEAGADRTLALDPLLRQIESGEFLPTRNTVLIVEEISQVGPRALQKLLEVQARTGMTIRGLGDHEQNQSIEAGDTIGLLKRALPLTERPELRSTVRQKTPALREIASLFRNDDERSEQQRVDDVTEALARKLGAGTARMLGGDLDEVNGGIADFFLRRRDALTSAAARKGITMSALTNEDAAAISRAVRERLKARGEIAADERVYKAMDQRGVTYDLPLAVGDRVRLFRRTSARIEGKRDWIGSNGDLVTIEAVTDTGLVVRNKHGIQGDVEWRRLAESRNGRLLLGGGWCQTVDAIQGITSDEHINALPRGTAGLTAFKNYPAESRAEWDTWTLIGEAGVFETIRGSKALGDQSEITTAHLWERVAKDMANAPRKPLGIDLVEQARQALDDATDRFMASDQRIQAQQAAGRRHAAERRHGLEAGALRTALAGQVAQHGARMRAAVGGLAPEGITAATRLGRLPVGGSQVRADRRFMPEP